MTSLMRLFFSLTLIPLTTLAGESSVFRFHLANEPSKPDPILSRTTDAQYLLPNIFRGLFVYDSAKGLLPLGAKVCRWENNLVLDCQLNPEFKWSDGTPVVAEHYLKTIRRIFDANIKSPQSERLLRLKGAREILAGQLPVTKLGVSSPHPMSLKFEFAQPHPDFLYDLALPALAPRKHESIDVGQTFASTGPYTISKWMRGQKIVLKPNPFYPRSTGSRTPPVVEVIFVEEDSTAIRLYENGDLGLLRKLPFSEIPALQKRQDFHFVPTIRFDYIGFGPELSDDPELRRALTLGLDYENLKKFFRTPGLPGCPGIPESFFFKRPCLKFDAKAARASLKSSKWHKRSKPNQKLKIAMSRLGGEDHKAFAEWLQHQWKINLDLNAEIQMIEQGGFLSILKTSPPMVFRKGLPLDHPTCLSALENFRHEAPENYIRFKNAEFDKIVEKMLEGPPLHEMKRHCQRGVEILLEENRLIPLGEIHFAILARPQFKGWKLNLINQLDLSELTFTVSK